MNDDTGLGEAMAHASNREAAEDLAARVGRLERLLASVLPKLYGLGSELTLAEMDEIQNLTKRPEISKEQYEPGLWLNAYVNPGSPFRRY